MAQSTRSDSSRFTQDIGFDRGPLEECVDGIRDPRIQTFWDARNQRTESKVFADVGSVSVTSLYGGFLA